MKITDAPDYPQRFTLLSSPPTTLEEFEEATQKSSNTDKIEQHTTIIPYIAHLDMLTILTHLPFIKNGLHRWKGRECFWYKDPHDLTVKERVQFKRWGDGHKLTLNPSHFKNYQHLISAIMAISYGDFEVLNSPITRLDCAVDLYRNFNLERTGIDFGKKRSFEGSYRFIVGSSVSKLI